MAHARRQSSTQATRGSRIALLLYPSYDPDGAGEELLTTASLLPKPFSRLPVHDHLSRLRAMLRTNNFIINALDGRISKVDLKREILVGLAGQPDVLMLVLCGHGVTPKPNQQQAHGTLRLSIGGAVSSADLAAWVAHAGFGGTLIQLLNMCHASHQQPLPANAAPSSANALFGGQLSPADPPSHRCITFYSCDSGDTQVPEHASDVIDAFIGAVGTPYKQLRLSWPDSGDWHGAPHPFCHMARDYGGVFPGKASD